MPPWPEWQFEYVGSRFLGKLLGLWSGLWVSLIRKLFRLVTRDRGVAENRSNHSQVTRDGRSLGTGFSFITGFSKIAVSTLLTLAVWRIATLQTVWSAVGDSGRRVLAAILLLVSASWVISLLWISCSRSRRKRIVVAASPSVKARYIRSNSAKAS
jgi:hypothetical protein